MFLSAGFVVVVVVVVVVAVVVLGLIGSSIQFRSYRLRSVYLATEKVLPIQSAHSFAID